MELSRVKASQVNGEAGSSPSLEFREYFLSCATTIRVKKGQYILDETDISRDAYLVLKGEIQFVLFSENGKETILRNLGPDRLFGEMAALNHTPRSISAVALEETSLARMRGTEFCEMLLQKPEFSFWLNQELAMRIENLTRKTFDLATQSVSRRIIGEILRLIDLTTATGDLLQIKNFPIHAKLAAKIGTHREAVTKELSQLTQEGIVKKSGRDLIIISHETLKALYSRLAR